MDGGHRIGRAQRIAVAVSVLLAFVALVGFVVRMVIDRMPPKLPAPVETPTEPPPPVPRARPPLAEEVPSRAVRVTVRSMDGTPILGARVSLVRGPEIDRAALSDTPTTTDQRPDATDVVGDDGRTEFGDVAAGRWFVVGEAPGYARHVVAGVTRAGDGGAETDVFLEKGATFTGTIRDADGAPAARVAVVLQHSGGASTWSPDIDSLRTTTDEQGAYGFGDVEPGRHRLWYAPHPGLLVLADRVVVPSLDGLDVRMVRGAALEGVVKDADAGTPLAGARVVATEWEGGMSVRTRVLDSGPTDREGRFVLCTWRRRCDLTRLLVDAPGYAPTPIDGSSEMPLGPLSDGQRFVFDLRVRRGASMHGTLTGPNGPLAGCIVGVTTDGEGFMSPIPDAAGRYCRTGADGRFRIDGVPAESAKVLVIDAESSLPLLSDALDVELTPGHELEQDVRVEIERVHFVRRTGDTEGNPVANVEVIADLGPFSSRAKSDAEGRVEGDIWCAKDCPRRIVLTCPGFLDTVTFFSIDDGDEWFPPMHRGEAWTGRVARRDGTPVGGLRLVAHSGFQGNHDAFPNWDGTRESVTGPDGAFRISLIGGPDHWFTAPATDAVDPWGGWFDPDDLAAPSELEFDDLVRIRGEVVVADEGKPIAGALIRDGVAVVARTGADGKFAFDWPPRFDDPLELRVEGWSSIPVDVVAEAQRLELAKRPLRIAGVARREDGSPASGFRVLLRKRVGEEFAEEHRLGASASDADGRFVIGGLDEGVYDVEVRDERHALAGRPLRVSAGAEKAELVLVTAAPLVIHVTNANGEPVLHALVTAITDGTASDVARTDGEGNATLGVLPQTTYTLRVEQHQFEKLEHPGARSGGGPLKISLTPKKPR